MEGNNSRASDYYLPSQNKKSWMAIEPSSFFRIG